MKATRGRKGSVAIAVLMALVLALSGGAPAAAEDWMIYVRETDGARVVRNAADGNWYVAKNDGSPDIGQQVLVGDITIDFTATTPAGYSFHMGANNTASGYHGTALGVSNAASGWASTALGSGNEASGDYGTALGFTNTTSGYGSTALGADNEASGDGSTALGADNEASGEESAAVGTNNEAGGKYSAALGTYNTAEGYNSAAVGTDNEAGGKYSAALGTYNEAYGEESAAVGTDNEAYADYSAAFGVYNEVYGEYSAAFGYKNTASGHSSTALGVGNIASGERSIAIGTGHVVTGARSGAFGDPTIISGADSYSVGNNNTIDANDVFVLGNSVTIASGIDGAVSLGSNSGVTVARGVALGASSLSDRPMIAPGAAYVPPGADGTAVRATVKGNYGAVSVGNSKGTRQITNVAAGSADTDAVNVAQLKAVANSASSQINDMRSQMGELRGDIRETGASAAALAGLKPMLYDPLEPSQFMIGAGHYRGDWAVALGLSHYPSENFLIHAGVAFGGDHAMLNAGMTWKFGDGGKKAELPERYRTGPIRSVYVMQQENIQLQEKVQEQDRRIAQLDQENAGMKETIAAMEAQLAAITKTLNMK